MGKRNGWFAKNPKGGQSGGSGGSKWPGNNNWKTAGSGQALGGGGEPEANRDSDVPYGYERVKEGGDGDCLFHALARQALGDTNLALQARRDVCEWMERQLPAMTSSSSSSSSSESELSAAHRELIRQQREELTKGSSEEVHRYVKKMRCRGEWGTGLEALAAAYVYKRPVQVWSPDGFSELRSPATASFPSTAKPSDEADTSPPAEAAAPAAVAKPIKSSEPIRLIHNGRNHWDSLAVRASDAAPARGPSSKAKTQAEKAEEDLAFAVSLSLVESFPSVAPDERTERRKAAALAAEARLQKLQSRGLGKTTEKEQAMVPAEALAGQGKEDMSGAKGAAGVPAAVPASSASAAAAAAAATTGAGSTRSSTSRPWFNFHQLDHCSLCCHSNCRCSILFIEHWSWSWSWIWCSTGHPVSECPRMLPDTIGRVGSPARSTYRDDLGRGRRADHSTSSTH
mmetsp:Transcript_72057/g.157070  ORF Transcript_72057/g.157070 Transcript_72057/m.157070 type:complete len:456 (+) Transcript_72057:90-1457(+)